MSDASQQVTGSPSPDTTHVVLLSNIPMAASLTHVTNAILPPTGAVDSSPLTDAQHRLLRHHARRIVPTKLHVFKEAFLRTKFGLVEYSLMADQTTVTQQVTDSAADGNRPCPVSLFDQWMMSELQKVWLEGGAAVGPTAEAATTADPAAAATTPILTGSTGSPLYSRRIGAEVLAAAAATKLVQESADPKKMTAFLLSKIAQPFGDDTTDGQRQHPLLHARDCVIDLKKFAAHDWAWLRSQLPTAGFPKLATSETLNAFALASCSPAGATGVERFHVSPL